MRTHKRHLNLSSFLRSQRAFALPVTFLMLFVSLTILISVTYYFSITKISAKTLALKSSGVDQEMLSLERVMKFISWSPGSYQIYEFDDFGGEFKVVPTAQRLVLNVTDNSSFHNVFFNSSVGKVAYELSSLETQENVFLKGDNRAILNQSSSTMTQLYISQGAKRYEITLAYRPLAGATVTGTSDGKPINSLRVYIINLNSSQSIDGLGNFRLKATCATVASNLRTYNFSYPITSLSIKANLDQGEGEVTLPISSVAQGAFVNLETVICNIKIEEVGW